MYVADLLILRGTTRHASRHLPRPNAYASFDNGRKFRIDTISSFQHLDANRRVRRIRNKHNSTDVFDTRRFGVHFQGRPVFPSLNS